MPTQSKIGWRPYVNPSITASSLWNSIYSVYNADAVGSSSLKTSLYAAYNGESNTNDSKGTNNGTAQGGLTYGTGKIGNAFNFNGSNAYVSLPVNNFNFTGDFSISCWFKTSTVSGNQMIFSNLMYNGGARKGYYIALLGDTVYVWLANTLSFQQNISTSSIISINTWYNIVVTRESGFVKLYVNNSLIVTDTNAITMEYVYTTPSIGAYTNGATTTWHFNGIVDALNVWQKSLTQSEITELYNSGNGAQYITDSFYKPTTNDALLVNNGTAQGGLTYEVGKVGTAFKFNGTTAYVQLGDVMDLGLSSWSYGMWFKSAVASSGTLFSKSIAAGLAGRFAAYIDSNRINFIFDYNSPLNSAGNTVNIGTSNTIVTNTWYHLVCVFDRTSNIRLYLNGVLQSVTTSYGVNDLSQYGAANTNYNTSCPFRIGAYTAADNINAVSFFNGSIDTFNVWNRVITASEITELYNSGNGKQYPN